MRRTVLSSSLLLIMLFQNSIGAATALGNAAALPGNVEPRESNLAPVASSLMVHLGAATGKTIIFKVREQGQKEGTDSPENEIPHLVLHRNGGLTPGFERTLTVSVENLAVPSSGMYVELGIETQHGDPDLDRRNNVRIRVWKEKTFVPYNGRTDRGVNVNFNIRFDAITKLPHKDIPTPTDYYRYRILVTDALGTRLQSYVQDYAFLLENQWRVPLPRVLEATPGAAPDELLIYYYDMVPFQTDPRDPESRLPREDVDRYIQVELLPAMVQAFRVQSDLWGFPWYEEWRNLRPDEDAKTLSVALGEYKTWFHGQPASLGHAMISIRVDGTLGEYDSLTDGIMSVFHHELFHNLQRNISLHYGNGTLAGKDEAWMMFSEGTAVLASSIGQPAVQFAATSRARAYFKRANAFLGSEGAVGGGLNKSYKDIPYHTALYWRFLYENCGGIRQGMEDPATGMQIVRQILETLYQGSIVRIDSSSAVAQSFPRIIDRALQATPSCAFHSYEQSLIHFARAIYMLRIADVGCAPAEAPTCGLANPNRLYETPPAEVYEVGVDAIEIEGSIPSSFGIDLGELMLDPDLKGKDLKLVFTSTADSDLEYRVELWRAAEVEGSDHGTQSAQPGEPVSMQTKNGSLTLEVEDLGSADLDGLGLIITRLDPNEDWNNLGAYTIQILAE